ncbi:YkgJ family cysteine cluster protein [Shewanella aestuarii]|uniref:YkgJ family cysteine cluster protein n=1 Tax=Shewanella aestuarii TaxID=1028752 RepID=A0A6G9QQY6_9GAMM|nr:YkgJ family cysteine cluster protein [Shewanella aestuarii]
MITLAISIKSVSPTTIIEVISPETTLSESEVSCANCQACCCRLEVILISDTGVPKKHIAVDQWGGEKMRRLDDGWCSALDRETLMCSIYELRPWICREFEMGSYECRLERAAELPASVEVKNSDFFQHHR